MKQDTRIPTPRPERDVGNVSNVVANEGDKLRPQPKKDIEKLIKIASSDAQIDDK